MDIHVLLSVWHTVSIGFWWSVETWLCYRDELWTTKLYKSQLIYLQDGEDNSYWTMIMRTKENHAYVTCIGRCALQSSPG